MQQQYREALMDKERNVIMEILEKRINETPGRVYLKYRQKDGKSWDAMTWKQYGEKIDDFSRALMSLGIEKGDKVALIGTSSPDWFIADMSIMTLGAVTVPIYFTSSGEQIAYIVNHSGAGKFIIFGDEYVPRLMNYLRDMPDLDKIILLNGSIPEDKGLFIDFDAWRDLLDLGKGISGDDLKKRRDDVAPDDVATYIYTSGTTGPPKAVMLTQKNCYAAAKSISASLQFVHETIETIQTFCFLTLAHVFERSNALLSPIETGAIVHFGNLSTALEDIREVKPTIVAGLPRTWEKIHEVIMSKRHEMPGEKQRIFDWALGVGTQYNTAVYDKKKIPLMLRTRHAVAKKLVIEKILAPLGFDNAKHFMTGGAVSSKEIIDFFFALGVWICQVYGQSESLGLGCVETRDKRRFGSVGIPFPGIEIKIADDGEILLKGDTVSPGYYNEPELNRETFKDGWLYSGDLGYRDEDGYLFITGRKKDIIITSGAKNITPAKIEASLMSSPLVEHAVVAGDGRKYLTALLTLNLEQGVRFALNRGVEIKTYQDLVGLAGLKEEIEKHVNQINEKYSRVEQIKKFRILPEPLSVESGELTSLNKIKRYKVMEKYAKEVDEMYS
jgi:long-chain acyl-CoA synthetase